MIKLHVKGWKKEEQTVKITNNAKLTLKTGKVVPSFSNMERKLIKALA